MLPRNWLLMLIALAAAIILFIMVNGCAAFSFARRHTSGGVQPHKEADALIIVVEHGFMFDVGQWWVRQRERHPGETVPVVLHNEVFSAQIVVSLMEGDDEGLSDVVWSSRQHEIHEGQDASVIIHVQEGEIDFAYYWYNIGSPDRARVQERIAFARSEEIPGKTFVFYGTWAENDEDDMWEQMEHMIMTLRPVPDGYLESHKGGAR